MKIILLFINGKLGLEIINFLSLQTDIAIVGVVANAPEKRASNYISQLRELPPFLRLFGYDENFIGKAFLNDVTSGTPMYRGLVKE